MGCSDSAGESQHFSTLPDGVVPAARIHTFRTQPRPLSGNSRGRSMTGDTQDNSCHSDHYLPLKIGLWHPKFGASLAGRGTDHDAKRFVRPVLLRTGGQRRSPCEGGREAAETAYGGPSADVHCWHSLDRAGLPQSSAPREAAQRKQPVDARPQQGARPSWRQTWGAKVRF